MQEKPKCFQCQFFQLTYDQGRPYRCLKFNFESKMIPWREVIKNSDASECLAFKPK